MFSKLRNKFVLITMGVATVILVIAFTAIFAITAANVKKPRPMAVVFEGLSESATIELESILDERLEEANAEHLARLALVLICVGLAVEILVFIASYYMAENAIKPVRDAYRRQREFIANASHELKTPLAIIQANFEALDINEQPWVDNINLELGRANHLIADLLSLTKAEEKIDFDTKEHFDATAEMKALMLEFEPRLGERKMKLVGIEKLDVDLNKRDWEQVVRIFLDNAMKYAKSHIVVKIEERDLVIANDGKTISKEKLNRIFDRFYQVDKTSEGSGLGLAIAQAVAQRNKWSISVASDKGWTSFRLAW